MEGSDGDTTSVTIDLATGAARAGAQPAAVLAPGEARAVADAGVEAQPAAVEWTIWVRAWSRGGPGLSARTVVEATPAPASPVPAVPAAWLGVQALLLLWCRRRRGRMPRPRPRAGERGRAAEDRAPARAPKPGIRAAVTGSARTTVQTGWAPSGAARRRLARRPRAVAMTVLVNSCPWRQPYPPPPPNLCAESRRRGVTRALRFTVVLLAALWASTPSEVAAQTESVTGLSLNSPASGDTWTAGETISATLTFNVSVSDQNTCGGANPLRLEVQIGSTTRNFRCPTGGGARWSTMHAFSYMVQTGDVDADGISIARPARWSAGRSWVR